MKITKVRYYDFNKSGKGKYLSRCSVILDDQIVLHEIKIFEGRAGRYIVMPSRSVNPVNEEGIVNDNREDLFHPVDKNFFNYMLQSVLSGYEVFEESGSYVYIP